MLTKFNNFIEKIIFEERLPSPWKLVKDIQQNYYKQETLQYSKQQLLSLCQKNWKFYSDLKNVDNSFKLIIKYCSPKKLQDQFKIHVSQFQDCIQIFDNQNKAQYIWINSQLFPEKNLQNFDSLIRHQLGRVWTNVEKLNKLKSVGNININNNQLNFNELTLKQRTIFQKLFFKNKELLKRRYEYIIKNDSWNQNYQFASHIDDCIRFLINHYLKNYSNISTQSYLNLIFKNVQNLNENFDLIRKFNSFNEYQKTYIIDLYLMFHFSSEQQLKIFKEQLFKQFGEIKK